MAGCACCGGVGVPCCSGSSVPTTLHLTIAGGAGANGGCQGDNGVVCNDTLQAAPDTCTLNGTFTLTWNGSFWAGTGPALSGSCCMGVADITLTCTGSGGGACNFGLVLNLSSTGPGGIPGFSNVNCFQISTCGTTAGTWKTSSTCSPFSLVSNPTAANQPVTCWLAAGPPYSNCNPLTFTITP